MTALFALCVQSEKYCQNILNLGMSENNHLAAFFFLNILCKTINDEILLLSLHFYLMVMT